MSAIIILLGPSEAIVATDTLSVDMDGSPLAFTSKAFFIPHLKTIVAGTGIAGLAGAWALTINERMLVRNLDHLDFHTQKGLRDLYSRDFGEIDGHKVSSTIYQVGIGEDGHIHGYSYSSFYDFASKPIKYGLQMKPSAGPASDPETRSIVQMMLAQREIQDNTGRDQRIYIGGEINAIKLASNGSATFLSLARFPDYEDAERSMYDALE